MKTEDPEDSPLLRQVLYTNDCLRLLSSVVTTMMSVAPPTRVKKALEQILSNWDERVALSRRLFSSAEEVDWED